MLQQKSRNDRFGFTLAEVLITLGIIGVVAAMTMPALINNSQNKELQAALNKGYSEISQALDLMKYDVGEDILPVNYPARTFAPIYRKYFKSLKTVDQSGIITGTQDEGGSYNPNKAFENYKTYNKSQAVKTSFFDDGQILLEDGTLILIENPDLTPYRIYITIDVNGPNKKPNIWGKDLFTFQITETGKLLPMGMDGTTYTDMDKYCSKNSNESINGIACTAKALSDPDFFKKMY